MYRETTRCRHPSSECPHNHSDHGSNGSDAGGRPSREGSAAGSDRSFRRTQSETVSSTPSSLSPSPSGRDLPSVPDNYCGKRRYSLIKFGYHLAVPMANRHTLPAPASASAAPSRPNRSASASSTPHVIALVGLPARGKTYISKKLSRYLNWIGINTKVFNLGEYRRKLLPAYTNADFFKSDNKEGNRLRAQVCEEAMNDVIRFLTEEDGEVAVFDATNTTRQRRRLLYQTMVTEQGFNLFFVESICDRKDIIENNITEVKVMSPDYVRYNESEVVKDFLARIDHYERLYETLDESLGEDDFSFLKIFNAGEKVLVHKHDGHIQNRIIYYLMNVHITPRTIYLTRHGESEANIEGRIGGDSGLTERGVRYSRLLAKYIESLEHPRLKIWTSWMRRAIQTTKWVGGAQERWKALNEIDAGLCDGMRCADIKEQYPDDFVARDTDKFSYRYPRGESYEDLVARLEPVILELERQDSVVLVAHQAVLRCLLGYYLETPEEDLPWLEVPLHTVIKLEPIAYGCKVHYIKFPVDCVSTHRKKPKRPGFRMTDTLVERRESDVNLEEDGEALIKALKEAERLDPGADEEERSVSPAARERKAGGLGDDSNGTC